MPTTRSIPGGEITESGAAFIGPTQDHIAKLASDFGVGTFPTYDTGDNVYVRDGNRSTYSDTGITGTAPPDPVILPDLAKVVSTLDSMATEVDVNSPWTAANAASWDAQTLQSFVEANSVTPQFRELIPAATRPIFGAEPRRALAPLHRLLHRGVRQRAERRDVRAELQHANGSASRIASTAAPR